MSDLDSKTVRPRRGSVWMMCAIILCIGACKADFSEGDYVFECELTRDDQCTDGYECRPDPGNDNPNSTAGICVDIDSVFDAGRDDADSGDNDADDCPIDDCSKTFTQVTIGWFHACAINTEGTVDCWGDEADGLTAAPDGEFLQISAAAQHTCGLRPDGSVDCWGISTNDRTQSKAGPFKEIDVGDDHNCAIRDDTGRVECWGANQFGQLDAPSNLVFDRIAAGTSNS